MERKLAGLSTIVTGATGGLGTAVAEHFVREGASVLLVARDKVRLGDLEAVLDHERAVPEQIVQWHAGDVSREADVLAAVERATCAVGKVDVLVCCAAVQGQFGPVDTVPWKDWVRVLEVDLLAPVLWCRAVLPLMRRAGRGKVVVVSGGGATGPRPRLSAYAAAKAGLVRFAETLAEEVRDEGIEVNAVSPGAMNTRMLDELLEAGPDRTGLAAYEAALLQRQSGGASLQEAASLIGFLASSESDGITGRVISAVWDPWRSLPRIKEQLADSDVYTLRRIVPADRGWDTA